MASGKRKRDYRKEYARRNQIAREQGFRSYGAKRYAIEKIKREERLAGKANPKRRNWSSYFSSLQGRPDTNRLWQQYIYSFGPYPKGITEGEKLRRRMARREFIQDLPDGEFDWRAYRNDYFLNTVVIPFSQK